MGDFHFLTAKRRDDPSTITLRDSLVKNEFICKIDDKSARLSRMFASVNCSRRQITTVFRVYPQRSYLLTCVILSYLR